MRRKERAVTELAEIIKIMEKCQVLSLALNGGDYPYVVPVNFGVDEADGQVTLYFHGAGEGTKIERLKSDSRAAFCMSAEEVLELKAPACGSTMRYESVCGRGRIKVVTDPEEKVKGLACVMRQYDREGACGVEFNEAVTERTTVLKLSVEELTGKQNRRK